MDERKFSPVLDILLRAQDLLREYNFDHALNENGDDVCHCPTCFRAQLLIADLEKYAVLLRAAVRATYFGKVAEQTPLVKTSTSAFPPANGASNTDPPYVPNDDVISGCGYCGESSRVGCSHRHSAPPSS